MSLYLPVKAVAGVMGIAICFRCQKKIYAGDLTQDPNNKNWYCKTCVDLLDPWRLPARQTEDIKLTRPRPDEALDPEGVV